MTLGISSPAPDGTDGTEVVALYRRITARLASLPGVQYVAMATRLPIGGIGISFPVEIEGRPAPPRHAPEAQTSVVGPDYFRALRIPVIKGRCSTAATGAERRPQ